MSRRRIAQFEGLTHTVKVHRDTEWNEYRVSLVAANGDIVSTYHSDDKEDALSTAQSILRHAEPAHAAEWWQKRIDSATTKQDFDLISDALCNDRTLTSEQFEALDNELSNQRWGAIEAEEEKARAAAAKEVAPARLYEFNVTVNSVDLLDLILAAGHKMDALAELADNEPDPEERFRLDNENGKLRKTIELIRTKWCAGLIRHRRMHK